MIEIIAIGNEVLAGITLNANAAFISNQLFRAGWAVGQHTALPDNREQLLRGLQEALQRSDLIICTGGLGATCDDNTREVAAELFGETLEKSEELAAKLQKRFDKPLPTLDDQSLVITHTKIVPNTIGTASGFILTKENKTLILLPGVPGEMQAMWQQEVMPYLIENFSSKHLERKWIYLAGLSEAQVDPTLRTLKAHYPTLEVGIYPHAGYLSICLESSTEEALAAYEELTNAFSTHRFEAPSGKLEEAVHLRFIAKKKTLSLAESCTGGSIAARLTQIPGASQYFLGSVVAYDSRLKTKMLDVPEELIRQKGAVSPEVAAAMLSGLLERTQSDYGAAVTGIAGPDGGTGDKPVGTVWGAIGQRGKPHHIWQIPTYGNRSIIIERSTNAILSTLLRD